MSLTEDQKNAFVDAYTRALISSWSSEEYARLLETDPRAALAEAGLELPAGARIEVKRHLAEADTSAAQAEGPTGVDLQLALYEKGLESGHFEFHMPDTPQIDTADLDMDELADMAGGGVYCCCCPCCCCS